MTRPGTAEQLVLAIQQHSFDSTTDVEQVFGDLSDAAIVGLLHHVGVLALAASIPDHVIEAIALSSDGQEICGVNHAVVGSQLLNIWGLPEELVKAVGEFHPLESCLRVHAE